ncbi:hypothetical protein GCM10011611_13390 [Aliidongia dinghuensis]|uniref:AzlD domain-containing protein n=1 Tax=Aliidongia dinghuensis TaxID=1867774 RepID=A0A8J2YRV5_9PROT|nr:AzlD domain-containing protein [Aliidongia dinghuensis]GGF09198.1 hypothetical protein GCM10011611_13390 [Aliidongia dinghuensis]
MTDWGPYPAILAVGLAAYAMRAGGFLVMGALPQGGLVARLLRLAPGNLFIAFVAAGIWEGGWPNLAGSVGAVAAMAVTKKEWAALAAGFAAAALAAELF